MPQHNIPPIPQNPISECFVWRDWFQKTGFAVNTNGVILPGIGDQLAYYTGVGNELAGEDQFKAFNMPALTGDLTTPGGSLATTLATVNSNVGTFTAVTVNAKGLTTAATNLAVTGDVTGTASGSALSLTLATVNTNVGTYGSATAVPQISVNGKGLITGVTAVNIAHNANATDYTHTGTGAVLSTVQAALDQATFNIRNFGASPAETPANNLTYIQATIDACVAAGGGIVYIPSGTYQISGTLSIAFRGVSLVGTNKYDSIIQTTSATANVISVTYDYTHINDLGISSSVPRTAGNYIYFTGKYLYVDNVHMNAPFIGIYITGEFTYITNCVIENIVSRTAGDTNAVTINVNGEADTYINYLIVRNDNASSAWPAHVIHWIQGDVVHIQNSELLQANIGMLVNPTQHQRAFSGFFSNVHFDTHITHCVALIPDGTTWVSGADALVDAMVFIGCQFGANLNGLTISRGTHTNLVTVQVLGCTFSSYTMSASIGVGTGIAVSGTVNNVLIDSNFIGYYGLGFLYGVTVTNSNIITVSNNTIIGNKGTAGAGRGLVVDGTTNQYTITGNIFEDNDTHYANAASGVTYSVVGNIPSIPSILDISPVSWAGIFTTQNDWTKTQRVTGQQNPTSGTGIELLYDGTSGWLFAGTRTGGGAISAYKGLTLAGSDYTLSIGGSTAVAIDSSRNQTYTGALIYSPLVGVSQTTWTMPAPSGGGLPDAAYTYKAPMVWEGVESKFGKWRQYYNAAEWGWGLTYNYPLDPYTVYPPASGLRDAYNTTASICAAMRFDVAESNFGMNFWGVEWAPSSTTHTAPSMEVALYYYDSGILQLSSAVTGNLIHFTSYSNYGIHPWSVGHDELGTFEIRDTYGVTGLPQASSAGSITGTVFTDATHRYGNFQVGMYLSGPGITDGTYITSLGTGTGHNSGGTYNINNTLTIGTNAISGSFGPRRFGIDTSGNILLGTQKTRTVGGVVVGPTVRITDTGTVGTKTIPDTCMYYLIDNNAITSITIKMPASPTDGQVVYISTFYTLAGVTHTGNSGQNLSGALSAAPVGGTGGGWVFMSSTATWFRLDQAV